MASFGNSIRSFTVFAALAVPSSALAFDLGGGGISADVDVSIGGGGGIGASADVGIGGDRGVGADVDVGLGGGSGVNASADIGVGGDSGLGADVDVSLGGTGSDSGTRDATNSAAVTRGNATASITNEVGGGPALSKEWGTERLLGKVLYSRDGMVLGLIDKVVKSNPTSSTVRVKLSRGSGVGRNAVMIRLPVGEYSGDAVRIGMTQSEFAQQYS